MPIESCHHHLQEEKELIIEILSRLPVKVLMKVKSVCKNWYEIIKNPYFINKHLQNYYESEDGHLLVQRFIPESRLYGFESFTNKTLANNLDLPSSVVDPYLQNTAFAQILGPLHGLYLLFNRKDRFALWNPGMREFKPLPSHPITDEFEIDELYDSPPVVGFGHDPSTNDYKVAWFIPEDHRIDKTMFLLYTLRNDCWRELKLDGSILSKSKVWLDSSLGKSNTYWNGFYYWRASIYRMRQLKIYALDMVNEIFLEIQGPPVPFTSLTMCNGRIATWRAINSSIEIWVMESVGFWTKQLTIGSTTNFRNIRGCWINGGIFFVTNARDSRLIVCNPSQELRDLGLRGDGHVFIHSKAETVTRKRMFPLIL